MLYTVLPYTQFKFWLKFSPTYKFSMNNITGHGGKKP